MEKSNFLEITVISAEELRIGNRPINKNACVTFRTDAYNHRSTTINRHGGSYLSWNEKLQLALPPCARSIAIEVHCKTFSGIKTVGSATVPISDVSEGYVPAHLIQLLSYRLRERNGIRNGIINFSVRMVGPDYVSHSGLAVGQGSSDGGKVYDGVAVGIPVSCGYRT